MLLRAPGTFLAVMLLLSACGGGGGGGGSQVTPTFSVGTSSLKFSAAGPSSTTPAGQSVNATVTGTLSGTLYILVQVSGMAVANVSQFAVSGNTGSATVSLGTGVAQSIPSTTSPTLRTAVTADGKTLFIARDAGVAVIPAPP